MKAWNEKKQNPCFQKKFRFQNSAEIHTNSFILLGPNTELELRYLPGTQSDIICGMLNDQENVSSQIWAGMKVIFFYFIKILWQKHFPCKPDNVEQFIYF